MYIVDPGLRPTLLYIYSPNSNSGLIISKYTRLVPDQTRADPDWDRAQRNMGVYSNLNGGGFLGKIRYLKTNLGRTWNLLGTFPFR